MSKSTVVRLVKAKKQSTKNMPPAAPRRGGVDVGAYQLLLSRLNLVTFRPRGGTGRDDGARSQIQVSVGPRLRSMQQRIKLE